MASFHHLGSVSGCAEEIVIFCCFFHYRTVTRVNCLSRSCLIFLMYIMFYNSSLSGIDNQWNLEWEGSFIYVSFSTSVFLLEHAIGKICCKRGFQEARTHGSVINSIRSYKTPLQLHLNGGMMRTSPRCLFVVPYPPWVDIIPCTSPRSCMFVVSQQSTNNTVLLYRAPQNYIIISPWNYIIISPWYYIIISPCGIWVFPAWRILLISKNFFWLSTDYFRKRNAP